MEEKGKDQLGATAIAVVVGMVALAARGISNWLAVAVGVVALAAWGISNWFGRPKPVKDWYQGATALAVAVAVAAMAAWGISKWLAVALAVAAMAAWGIPKWFGRPKPEENKYQGAAVAAVAVGAAAAVGVAALAAWGISKQLESSETEPEQKDKMMKAPGRDYYMPRKDFVKDPSTYFRNLRDKN